MSLLKKTRLKVRDLLVNNNNKKILKNQGFTIIASDCIGGVLYHDLGMEFFSPTINMFFSASDYIKFLSDMPGYIEAEMEDITQTKDEWPVARLKDITLQLVHYKSVQEAQDAWSRRAKRINYDNMYIVFSDRNGFSEDDIKAFTKMNYKNMVCFVSKKDLADRYNKCFFIDKKDPNNDSQVYPLMGFSPKWSYKRIIDKFDYTEWFNSGVL